MASTTANTDGTFTARLPSGVAGVPGGVQAGLARCVQLVPQPAPQQVTAQGPDQLPGMCAEPGSGGTVDGGQQRRVFCGKPAECVLGGGELVHDDPRLCRAQREWIKIWCHHRRGAVPGVQIVVQHPADGRVTVLVRIHHEGLFGGVCAQQVVEGIAARGVLRQQMRASKLGQQSAGPPWRDGGAALARGATGSASPRH